MAKLEKETLLVTDRMRALDAGAHLWICAADERFPWFRYFVGKLHWTQKDLDILASSQNPLSFISPLRLSCERLVFLTQPEHIESLLRWQWPDPSLVVRFFVPSSWQELILRKVGNSSSWSREWVTAPPVF